jgi:hypothetical protein
MASIIYSEQVGVNLHDGGNNGDIRSRYIRIRKMAMERMGLQG